jgi:hypothetical protein
MRVSKKVRRQVTGYCRDQRSGIERGACMVEVCGIWDVDYQRPWKDLSCFADLEDWDIPLSGYHQYWRSIPSVAQLVRLAFG